jgi:hypothetical protein
MKLLNATNLDRKSGIRGPKKMGEALRQLFVPDPTRRSSHSEISLASQVVHHGSLCLRLFSERTADDRQQMDITDGFL